ncbi:hypothetical protein C8R46DRAFT_1350735 [Mycena filopes]|nr:hypothetical protein C8R46DRAFT_1350735 [Mycena filopes]
MSTSKTSSPSLVLILCFFAFILGQVFNAFCARLSSPAQIVEKVVVVHIGYSFKTLMAVVLLAIIANNLAFAVGYRYLTTCRSAKIAQRHQTARIIDRLDIPRHDSLFLLPPAVSIPSVSQLFARLAILRPSWTFKILCRPLFTASPKTTIPLLEHPDPAALALVPPTKSHPVDACIPDGLPTFIRVFRNLAVKSYRFEGRVFRGRLRFPIHLEEVKERTLKSINEEGHQEDKVERRPSCAGFLQHLAAAALLRKCQFQVEEEVCYATVVEIEEEEDDKRLHEDERVEPGDEDKDFDDEHLSLNKDHQNDEQVIEEQNTEIENDRDVRAKQDIDVGKSMDGVVDAMASSTEKQVDEEEEEEKRMHEDERVEPADEHKDLKDEHLQLNGDNEDDELVIEEKKEELENENEAKQQQQQHEDAEDVKNEYYVEVEKDTETIDEGTDATYVDAMPGSGEQKKNDEEEEEETFFDAVSGLEGEEMKIPDEKDETQTTPRSWPPIDDDLPSYEEFAMGVPSDILFVTKSVDSIHDVCRPPLLSLLSARLGPKVPECGVNRRASHISLLTRLGPRIGAES